MTGIFSKSACTLLNRKPLPFEYWFGVPETKRNMRPANIAIVDARQYESRVCHSKYGEYGVDHICGSRSRNHFNIVEAQCYNI